MVFNARMRRAGVGKRHAEFIVNQFTTPEIRDVESDWWIKFQTEKNRLGTGILDVLVGPRGRGKTMLASMLIGCACWRDQEPVYTTAMDMLRDIRSSFDAGDYGAKTDRRKKYDRAGLLVIDEFHRADKATATSDWSPRTLEAILDTRYRGAVDTVLITNDSPEQFVKHCGTSVASRIKECGRIIVLDGEDFRLGGDA